MEFWQIFGSFQRGSITVGRMAMNYINNMQRLTKSFGAVAFQVSDRHEGYILNKSENATPENCLPFILYAKWCKPVKQMKVYLNVQRLVYA